MLLWHHVVNCSDIKKSKKKVDFYFGNAACGF